MLMNLDLQLRRLLDVVNHIIVVYTCASISRNLLSIGGVRIDRIFDITVVV